MPSKPPRPAADAPASAPSLVARTTEVEVVIAPPSLDPSRPVLTLLTGVNAGETFAIERPHTIIGRAREARVRVDTVGVSRRHARIVRASTGELSIEDLGSTNGVYVNGVRVKVAELTPGDQLQIGSDVLLRYTLVDAAQERLARQLFESSTRDALTGAYNRKYFVARLDAEVAYAARHRTRLAVLVLDLDHFKQVNDTHGHAAGDAVLRTVGLAVGRLLRTEDVFARYGGEEFAIIVRGVPAENVELLAERVRKRVADVRVTWSGGEGGVTPASLSVTLSIGGAMLDECPADGGGTALVALADARLYRAKGDGRNRIVMR